MTQIHSSLTSEENDELWLSHGRLHAESLKELEYIPVHLANFPKEYECFSNRSKQRNPLGLEWLQVTSFNPINQSARLSNLRNRLLGANLKRSFEFEHCCRMGPEHPPMNPINKFKDIQHATSSSNRYLQSAFY